MKLFFATVLIQAGALLAQGAASPIYINNSPLTTPPQVDATIFWNRSTIDIFTSYPYQAQNVQFWTNNGVMNGSPGFIFEYDLDGKRARRIRANSRNLQRPATSFFNDGNISGASALLVNARNVTHSGRFDSGEAGLISILATNGTADLSRSSIRAGPATGILSPCDFLPFGTNFFPEVNVTGLYFGAGRNNALGTNGQPLDLTQASAFFNSFFPQSPSHEVRVPRSTFTNTVVVPGFNGCSGSYDVFVHTNFSTATSMVVNIAFVPTNSLLEISNLSVDVRFAANSGPAGFAFAPVIEFRSVDFDIVDQAFVTNYVTLMDTAASLTNIVLARPFVTGTGSSAERRPNNYNLVRGRFCSFDFSDQANSVFDPTLFYGANSQTTTVDTIYGGYSAQVGQTNSQSILTTPFFIGGTIFTSQLGANPALSDPTNFTGRVEIKAGKLNVANMRIRAENFVGIKANSLSDNVLAQVDAPFVSFDVQSTNAELVIKDLAPASVNRLSGQISAYSSVWNSRVTNTVSGAVHTMRFHVLIVDNCLRSTTPVTLHRFAVRTPSLIIKDNLLVNSSASIVAKSICVESNATLALPAGADFAFTNVNDLLNFTNNGVVSVSGGGYFGTFDTGHIPAPPRKRKRRKPTGPTPLDNFINHGTMAAAALFVRSTNTEIGGTTVFPAFYVATQGVVFVSGSTVSLSNVTVAAGGDAEFHANDLLAAGTVITAGITNGSRSVRGALVLDATNSFGDFERVTTNEWRVTSGVRIPTRPANVGDLMGTHIYSTAGPFWESPIVWAGEDRGPFVEGYVNNLALGRLTLDGAIGNLFHFQSAGVSNAIYVDYLELLNSATNFSFVLGVDEDFTIYFGDSNVPPEKLDDTGGGRVRWVSQFVGPQSGTNITYPNGVTYRFNAGLVRSRDLDSDGDGVVNGEDCTPLPVPDFDSTQPCPAVPDGAKSETLTTRNLGLTITTGSRGRGVALSWDAAANSVNAVEFSDAIAGSAWRTLTNFINGPVNARVTVRDAAGGPLRVYRVRVDAGKP
jgi:hypothetical protein